MVRSLLIKLAMLAVTLGSLVWIGSVTPVRQVAPPRIQLAAPSPPSAVSRPSQDRLPMANAPSPIAGLPAAVSNIPVSVPVTSLESLPSTRDSEAGSPDISRRVDLNRATASDLEALPGIGPKLAQRVIEHRTSHGPFKRVEDLRQVKGIGHKKFDQLRSHVLVTQVKASRPKGTS